MDLLLLFYFQGIDLNVGDLQMYGTVSWLNALDEIGKIKKGIDLVCTLFVFKSGVVLLAQERIKGKKKPKVKYPYCTSQLLWKPFTHFYMSV